MKKRKMVVVLTSFAVAASFCITSLGSVSTPATADAATSSTAGRENGKKENVVEELSQDVELEEGVNLEIPVDLSFSIDSINLMEKGQIYSKEYTFKNNGNRDVRITFSEIYYTFSNETDFRSLKSLDELNTYSTTKDIFLYLENVSPKVKMEVSDSQQVEETLEDFDPNVEMESEENNEEEYIEVYKQMEEQKIVITDELQKDAGSFVLSGNKNSAANAITFRFNGAVTEFPEVPWEDGDVEIHVVYKCFLEEKEEKVPETIAVMEETTEAVDIDTAEKELPEESNEGPKESGFEETGDLSEENETLEETDGSSKEDSAREEENEEESGASGGTQPSEDKDAPDNKPDDVGTKEEVEDSSQKEESSDNGNSMNQSGDGGTENSDSEENSSSEKTGGGKDNSSNEKTE